jgi:hypothetical protein
LVRNFFGGGKGQKYCATCKVDNGQSLSTCIGKGRDEKARRWGLKLCFGWFVLYKMGHLKDVAREAKAS